MDPELMAQSEAFGGDGGDTDAAELGGTGAFDDAPGGEAVEETATVPVVDPVAAYRQSEDYQRELRRAQREVKRQLVADVRRALDGDDAARRALESDGQGRKLLAEYERRVAQSRVAPVPDWKAKYYEIEALADSDPTAYARYHKDPTARAWLRQAEDLIAAEQAAAGGAGAGVGDGELADAYADLRATEEAALLTEDDWDALHPDNFEGMSPAKAAAAMAREYGRRLRAAAGAAPATAASGAPPTLAQAARAAARTAPPLVAGQPPARSLSFDEAAARYADNPSPQNRAAYERARASRGW